ncbi:deoxyribodipyrimidine photolyase [Roseivirga sp. 4D4]|uniref:FAD-binding domain-containing protein n=1 Tax=Roseivirga sp. 4D4 TaxID=1889784 RepID=UPI000852EF58|nr:FAD-binding domain-containing protein [Roseivirga sp. 4D4]OEK01838.1 deoxyribodipyrimidine photolyase [Roseivirga sp. 4D4]
MIFDTSYASILEKIDRIDPIAYGKDRNYVDGSVSYLSPYISRGVISTKFVLDRLLERGFQMSEIEKFVQELAWRDYWQQVWITKGEAINQDLKREQPDIGNYEIPNALINADTGIHIVDQNIQLLYDSGYVHNHMRMYLASIACNIAKSHWHTPAKWMYYHLLDGDWASNALSWQWVSGANANKKYYANQENINNFFYSKQKNTFLDVPYEHFESLLIPEALNSTAKPELKTSLPRSTELSIDTALPTLAYNYYNLDPNWRTDQQANRILVLDPKVFEQYPVSNKCIDFAMVLSKNISGIQYFRGSFQQLRETYGLKEIFYKEHPLNQDYQGTEDSRDWMFDVKGYYPSFFAFWKKCKKEIKQW